MPTTKTLDEAIAAPAISLLGIAIFDFAKDSSGVGVVFVIFAAVFIGLASSERKRAGGRSS